MESSLRQFLREAYGMPFVYGERDCALWVCDWIRLCRGIDPGAAFRGRYRTRLGCARLLRREGGLLDLASRVFAAAGLVSIDGWQLQPGDVGCVATEDGPALAIDAGHGRWAWKGCAGLLVSARWPELRVWRI